MSLSTVFQAYCDFGGPAGGTEMDSMKFAKMIREAGLLDGKCTLREVDVAFTIAKTKGARRLAYDNFLIALDRIGSVKWPDVPADEAFARVEDAILLHCAAPARNATTPRMVGVFEKLAHVGSFTGAHREKFYDLASGKAPDRGAVFDLSQITRSHLNTGSTLLSPRPPPLPPSARSSEAAGSSRGSVLSEFHSPIAASRPKVTPKPSGPPKPRLPAEPSSPLLQHVFLTYCELGGGEGSVELDGVRFVRMMREAGVLDGACTTVDVDVVFATVKRKECRKICFEEFVAALIAIGARKFPSLSQSDAFRRMEHILVADRPAPRAPAPAPDAVVARLTDVAAYTGVHKERFDAGGKGLGLREDVGGRRPMGMSLRR